jgi:Fur family zinc uptake transcriptional regulator
MSETTRRPLSATQERVRAVLTEAGRPLSAYEVLDRLKGEGISAPPTVYRALERLMRDGLAHRLESLNAFVACTHPHHHDRAVFAICEGCGTVSEFLDSAVEERLEAWAKRHSFDVRRIAVEISGRCAACRAQVA